MFLDKIVADNEKIKRKISVDAVGGNLQICLYYIFKIKKIINSKGMIRGVKLGPEESLGEILGILDKIFTNQWYISISNHSILPI